jgi:hypothetical protein
MDTDDFSELAYDIIVQAARFSDTLKTELGALSRNYKNENDWLRAVQEHCREIIADPDAYVDFWDLAEEEGITASRISEIAGLLSAQVDIVLAVPLINRGQEFSET